jgi:hypothetical protein
MPHENRKLEPLDFERFSDSVNPVVWFEDNGLFPLRWVNAQEGR